MITLPPEFEAIPIYPGYFWNVEKQKLYSIKMGGTLRELRLRKVHWKAKRNGAFPCRRCGEKYYEISVNGRRSYLFVDVLKNLNYNRSNYEVPITREY